MLILIYYTKMGRDPFLLKVSSLSQVGRRERILCNETDLKSIEHEELHFNYFQAGFFSMLQYGIQNELFYYDNLQQR